MSQNIPIPASTARKLATSALEEAENQRQSKYFSSAKMIQNAVKDVMDTNTRKNGEFVSIPASSLGTLAAYGDVSSGRIARIYLKKYNWW